MKMPRIAFISALGVAESALYNISPSLPPRHTTSRSRRNIPFYNTSSLLSYSCSVRRTWNSSNCSIVCSSFTPCLSLSDATETFALLQEMSQYYIAVFYIFKKSISVVFTHTIQCCFSQILFPPSGSHWHSDE